MHTANPSYRTPWDDEPELELEPAVAIVYLYTDGDYGPPHYFVECIDPWDAQEAINFGPIRNESLLLIY